MGDNDEETKTNDIRSLRYAIQNTDLDEIEMIEKARELFEL